MAGRFFSGAPGFGEGWAAAEDRGIKQDTLAQDLALRTRGLDIQQQSSDRGDRRLGQDLALRTRALDIQQQSSDRGDRRLGQDLALRTRALDLTEQAQKNTMIRDLLGKADKQVADTMETISATIDAGLAAGRDPAVIAKTIQPLLQSAKSIAAKAGQDPTALEIRVQTLMAKPTGVEAAVGKVKSGIAAAGAVSETTGVPQREALQGQGVIKPTTDISKRNLLLESGLDKPAESLTPDQLASGMAGGRFVVSINPQTNERQVIDLATGRVVGQSTAPPQKDIKDAPAQDTLTPKTDVTQAIGLEGKVKNAINTLSDIFGTGDVPYKNSLASEAALNTLATTTISYMQDAVPGRPNVFLLEKLNELTVKPNEILVGKARAKERLSSIRGLLAGEIERVKKEVIDRPGEWKPAELQKSKSKLSQMSQILAEYTKILDTFGGADPTKRPSLESFGRAK